MQVISRQIVPLTFVNIKCKSVSEAKGKKYLEVNLELHLPFSPSQVLTLMGYSVYLWNIKLVRYLVPLLMLYELAVYLWNLIL